MFDLREIWEEHKSEVVCTIGAIAVLLFNGGNIAKTIAQTNQLRDSAQIQEADSARIMSNQLLAEQKSDIANKRYEGGCTVIFSLNQQGHYTAITEGEPILKGEFAAKYRGKNFDVRNLPKNVFLPAGMSVCDAYGNTAKLAKDPTLNNIAVATDIANTGDQRLIKSAMDRARGIYTNPIR